ncbi:hypothetical protein HZH68_000846 [Vespula germanica]|uniref:Biogenesis of lysosome-related organelles complex 1 subunit 2 n=1 Tax=Vespula germanica TaxID=30212 RepID=A0A834NUC1_VESGE|nr:hypothetical protein HZH68_000846 [Vespula germanica]
MTTVNKSSKEPTQSTVCAQMESSMTDGNSRCESPKRGTTLSTSTSSFEALDPHDPNLSRLANTMFQKTGEYLQEELTATHADYRLLERLNKETIAKYTELKTISSNVSISLDSLNEKYKNLRPILENIDQIDDSVNKLEQAAYKLEAYSKRLEAKFKDLEKDLKKNENLHVLKQCIDNVTKGNVMTGNKPTL